VGFRARQRADPKADALLSMARMLAMWPAPNEREVVLRALIAQLEWIERKRRRPRVIAHRRRSCASYATAVAAIA